ncbi:hypothetical protein CEXT_383771 [Caerostris extrusa]|uniref:Uncharacterized protein n=1 Tax=Caerostris extrusa TaxID=172846 RepID=A0AAV4NXI5_CAEEX|nr:hypothetical protein CEXT_383771 [Caerostris extrusa]
MRTVIHQLISFSFSILERVVTYLSPKILICVTKRDTKFMPSDFKLIIVIVPTCVHYYQYNTIVLRGDRRPHHPAYCLNSPSIPRRSSRSEGSSLIFRKGRLKETTR